ncbi:hypothetical protein K2173_010749 [Erythroxylum novogranatense]|uniref:Rab3GAP catalytic subunit conserved domain-containing protein n=1 Tax=Erythroxylum novogranatense TaxID=1862640 RepID=A0AAV8SRG5_9ROSI|nr:hypothetical protein K2173_010749 [Erythroxylum novogranatense]
MAVPYYDENLYILNMKNDAEGKSSQISYILERLNGTNQDAIPSSSVLKQLAIAVDAGKNCKSMKDLLASCGGSSPIRERASLSLAAVKSLVCRDKEDKLTSELGDDEKVSALMQSLFNAEGNFLRRNVNSGSEALLLAKDIHGAPPMGFLVKLSEVIGSFKTLRKMALLWCKVVSELRRHWSEELHIPGVPLDEVPDLKCCLLYQQFQVINCCLSRKIHRDLAIESLESIMKDAGLQTEESTILKGPIVSSHILCARISSGELVLRLGANCPAGNLTMLETGEPIYTPVTQEGPLLTEDLIKETEEFVLRTGSVGAGCSQLLSDMQAFKAANPGCILEDFVRWHSPPDWTENDSNDVAKESTSGFDSSYSKGQLSSRMQKEGNLWRELWETSKPVPAVKQAPLFDEDLAVEGILNDLEDISPSELFEQLFISLLGLGFVMAETKLSHNTDLSKLFQECKDYIIITCQGSSWGEKLDDLCQVYETVEAMVLNPEEAMKTVKQTEEIASNGAEMKRRFMRLGLYFGNKDKTQKKISQKENNSEESQPRQAFANFFDSKSSILRKKPPKPDGVSPQWQETSPDESEWTVV